MQTATKNDDSQDGDGHDDGFDMVLAMPLEMQWTIWGYLPFGVLMRCTLLSQRIRRHMLATFCWAAIPVDVGPDETVSVAMARASSQDLPRATVQAVTLQHPPELVPHALFALARTLSRPRLLRRKAGSHAEGFWSPGAPGTFVCVSSRPIRFRRAEACSSFEEVWRTSRDHAVFTRDGVPVQTFFATETRFAPSSMRRVRFAFDGERGPASDRRDTKEQPVSGLVVRPHAPRVPIRDSRPSDYDDDDACHEFLLLLEESGDSESCIYFGSDVVLKHSTAVCVHCMPGSMSLESCRDFISRYTPLPRHFTKPGLLCVFLRPGCANGGLTVVGSPLYRRGPHPGTKRMRDRSTALAWTLPGEPRKELLTGATAYRSVQQIRYRLLNEAHRMLSGLNQCVNASVAAQALLAAERSEEDFLSADPALKRAMRMPEDLYAELGGALSS